MEFYRANRDVSALTNWRWWKTVDSHSWTAVLGESLGRDTIRFDHQGVPPIALQPPRQPPHAAGPMRRGQYAPVNRSRARFTRLLELRPTVLRAYAVADSSYSWNPR